MPKLKRRHGKPQGMNLAQTKAHEKAVFDVLVEARAQELWKKRAKYLIQWCIDCAFIAAAVVFQMGPGRCKAFGEKIVDCIYEMADLVVDDAMNDPEFEYARESVDRKLKKICGDNFEPWEVRYDQRRSD